MIDKRISRTQPKLLGKPFSILYNGLAFTLSMASVDGLASTSQMNEHLNQAKAREYLLNGTHALVDCVEFAIDKKQKTKGGRMRQSQTHIEVKNKCPKIYVRTGKIKVAKFNMRQNFI